MSRMLTSRDNHLGLEEIGEHLKCIEAKASSPPQLDQWPLSRLKILKSTCVMSGSSSENVPQIIITACDKDVAPIPAATYEQAQASTSYDSMHTPSPKN